jgi:hypothetical protein
MKQLSLSPLGRGCLSQLRRFLLLGSFTKLLTQCFDVLRHKISRNSKQDGIYDPG